jgi:UDP-N-acetylglucosamine 2-epimerase
MAKRIEIIAGGRSDSGLLEPLALKTGYHMTVLNVARPGDMWQTCEHQACILRQSPSLFDDMGNPDKIVLLGDRWEILVTAIAAYNMGIEIAHIEGSDTTLGSLDEGHRKCIRSLASQHFDVEEYGSLGCVMPKLPDLPLEPDYVFCYHPWNGPWKEEFERLLKVIEPRINDGVFILANADAGGDYINSRYDELGQEPISPERHIYLSILAKADYIIGNSSSGLIEAPQLRTTTLNIGDRQKGRLRGPSVIDWDMGDYRKATDFSNPYYQSDTLERIAEEL